MDPVRRFVLDCYPTADFEDRDLTTAIRELLLYAWMARDARACRSVAELFSLAAELCYVHQDVAAFIGRSVDQLR